MNRFLRRVELSQDPFLPGGFGLNLACPFLHAFERFLETELVPAPDSSRPGLICLQARLLLPKTEIAK